MSNQLKFDRVSDLLVYTYHLALSKHDDLYTEYTALQYKLPIPANYAIVNTQSYAQLDMVIRSLEDEICQDLSAQNSPASIDYLLINLHIAFSEIWIIGIYELLRAAKEYSPKKVDIKLFHDIEIIRIPLAKYQIAKDKKLTGPLYFDLKGSNSAAEKSATYDNTDRQRTHHLPRSISERGSAQWCTVDVTGEEQQRWLERRDISDRFLNYLRNL
ncbi:hypothetical protein [Roseicyclus sp.]|uniref:hypothetical protein n=1 Tax=Roseicyclus sp. TaxID=1914329 RepID=UPI001BCF69C1|nr:hypothetical protein [Roseicyclus sp.]